MEQGREMLLPNQLIYLLLTNQNAQKTIEQWKKMIVIITKK